MNFTLLPLRRPGMPASALLRRHPTRTLQGTARAVLLLLAASIATISAATTGSFCHAASQAADEELQNAGGAVPAASTSPDPDTVDPVVPAAGDQEPSDDQANPSPDSQTPASSVPQNGLAAQGHQKTIPEPPSKLTMIGVPLAAGLILMGIFAVLLRGSDFREPEQEITHQ